MTDEAKALVATPAATLEQHIMDPNIPKSEAEWWARNRIETQAREIERLREALGDLIEAVQRRTADLGGYDGRFGLNKSIVKARAALGESHD